MMNAFFFFFQAEDGIRDGHVTGVQTCALPIFNSEQMAHYVSNKDLKLITPRKEVKARNYQLNSGQTLFIGGLRSEERRVGKEWEIGNWITNRKKKDKTQVERVGKHSDNSYGRV